MKTGLSAATAGTVDSAEPLGELGRVPAGAVRVSLPAGLAAEAVQHYLKGWRGLRGQVHTTKNAGGRAVPEGCWAISIDRRLAVWAERVVRGKGGGLVVAWNERDRLFFLQPLHSIVVVEGHEDAVLRSLEAVKPERLDERGLPVSWRPAAPPTRSLGGERGREDDVERVDAAPALPPAPAGTRPELDPSDDDSIASALAWAAGRAGFGAVPLVLVRQDAVQDGFVPGRIWLAPGGPVKVRLDPGPNADAAELWATLLHELSHGLAGGGAHDRAFRAAMVGLAESIFTEGVFAQCWARLDGATTALDAWLSLCIRAALRGTPPPVPVKDRGDEGQLARVVGRITKLRRLARSSPGSPEAVSASAVANELLLRWDLGSYQVRLEAGIDEAMCDRWVSIGKRSVWRRTLAFTVAEHFGVFALSRKDRGWMHFFGRYSDVVTAEWFYEVWEAHILRASDDHIRRFKKSGGPARRSTRTERTNFCDSAVVGLTQKLRAVRRAADDDTATRLFAAERLAEAEHARRGVRWSSSTGKTVTLNQEGMAAGQAAPMGRGVPSRGGTRGLLKG
jgi:hypothetical protein